MIDDPSQSNWVKSPASLVITLRAVFGARSWKGADRGKARVKALNAKAKFQPDGVGVHRSAR